MFLFAQAPPADSLWPDVVRAMAGNGLWVFLSVLFLLWTAEGLVKRYLQHRERMAMIDAGMNPADLKKIHDADGDQPGSAAPADRETVDFRGTG